MPEPGRGPVRIGGRIVVVEPVHALICGFALREDRIEGHPGVAPCCGCGMAVRVAAPREQQP